MTRREEIAAALYEFKGQATFDMTATRLETLVQKAVEAEREATRQGWATADASAETAARVILERDGYLAALTSIATNTCCGSCQEAALVALAAIRARTEGKE